MPVLDSGDLHVFGFLGQWENAQCIHCLVRVSLSLIGPLRGKAVALLLKKIGSSEHHHLDRKYAPRRLLC